MGHEQLTARTQAGPALRLVTPAPAQAEQWVWFCGRCAATPASREAPAPSARVCAACGMGLLLETCESAAPRRGQAFLVADSRLTVQALSPAAEELLRTEETLAIDRPVSEFLVPAQTEGEAPLALADALGVALGHGEPVGTFVRPRHTYGIRLRAKIAACGPPRAALIVVGCAPPRIRLV